MKKGFFLFLFILCFIALMQLSGCTQGSFSDQLDIERLLPVQALGFDRDGEGVAVTLSTGKELQNTSPLVMKSLASGIEPALIRLQDYSPQDELYYDHVQYIILGESMAEDGIAPVLDWVERSPFMRMDTYVFLVTGSASEAMINASGEMTDITEHLSSLEREAIARGQHIYSVLEIASSLADRNNALCTTIESVSSMGTVFGPQGGVAGNAVIPAGYSVLKDGKLAAHLSQNESLGIMLFENDPTGTEITVSGTVLELLQGKAEATGQWAENGTLSGILVTAHVTAGILEQEDPDLDINELNTAFTQAVRSWLEDVLGRSQSLSCDFLALRDSVLCSGPENGRNVLGDWDELFSTLPITVQVQAEIRRGYDRAD